MMSAESFTRPLYRTRRASALLDGPDHRRVVVVAISGLRGALHEALGRGGLGEVEPGRLGERDGIGEVLDDVAGGEGAARRMVVGQERLHPVIAQHELSLIHISEPTRLLSISYAVF